MSVRDGLLAVLTLGPAYGLQLHAEFSARATHRKPVNVGQIYSTLERLAVAGLIEPAGTTDDSLPLHRLTEDGTAAAHRWMTRPVLAGLPEWTEMLDQVLVTSSIDPRSAMTVATAYRRWWEDDLRRIRSESTDDRGHARLALLAREAQGVAAAAWLGSAIAALVDFDTVRPLSDARPRRGRRAAAR